MEIIQDNERPYTTFVETYRIISFVMGIGMIYPSPETVRRRLICMLLYFISVVPLAVVILINIYDRWLERDIIEIIRHSTVVGPFLGGFFKMFLMSYKTAPAKTVIDEINTDYASYNNLTEKYKRTIDASIDNNLVYSERGWTITVLTCVMTFPCMAITLTIYNCLFKSIPQKYMIHDLIVPNIEPEGRFESPVFEVVFVYMFYCCLIYVMNFIGYDGFFGLCINHACLKMKLYCMAFEEALQEMREEEMFEKIVRVIREQNRLKNYVDKIQDTFNVWLGIILIATMIQIGNCLYHLTEGYELDLRYIIFIIGTIIHIYLPCRYSAKLKHMSVETATLFYCAGWETVPSNKIRKMVLFMIAKGQIPMEITAFNLLIFDMDLFVRILNSSYSMYTLLRS